MRGRGEGGEEAVVIWLAILEAEKSKGMVTAVGQSL